MTSGVPFKKKEVWMKVTTIFGKLYFAIFLILLLSNCSKVDEEKHKTGNNQENPTKTQIETNHIISVESLINQLKDNDSTIRGEAARTLGKIGNKAIAPLLLALKHENPNVREGSAWALGEIKNDHAVEPLIATLMDTDSNVQIAAARALGDIRDPRAISPLFSVLKNEYYLGDLSNYAGEAIWKIDTEILLSALKDKDVIVRRSAIGAFSNIRDPRAFEPLIAALKDADSEVRLRAAEDLGLMKNIEAVDRLIAASEDKVPDVRAKIMEALGDIDDPRAIESLILHLKDKEEIVRVQAENTLKAMHTTAIDSLVVALQSNDSRIQQGAAFVLADSNDDHIIAILTSAFKDKKLPIVAGAYSFFIKQGIYGSESNLIEALNKHGDKRMAEDFINCGNQSLGTAGRKWASTHGYAVSMGYGGGPQWRNEY
jgi:HEAT repeat protein